jgi:hypothetical protein
MSKRVLSAVLLLLAGGLVASRLWTAVVANSTTGDTDTSEFYVVKHHPSWQFLFELDEKADVGDVGTPFAISEFGLPLEPEYLEVMRLVPFLSPVCAALSIVLFFLRRAKGKRTGAAN